MYYDGLHFHEHTVNIEEKRAATDESVKLLNEFHEKAKSNLVASIKLDDNRLDGVACFFMDTYGMEDLDRWVQMILRFTLNGKEYEINDRVSVREFTGGAEKEKFISFRPLKIDESGLQKLAATSIINHISRLIAIELVGEDEFIRSKVINATY